VSESSKEKNGRTTHLFDIHDKSKYVPSTGSLNPDY